MSTYAPYEARGDGPNGFDHAATPAPAPPAAAPVDGVAPDELDKLPIQALLVRLGRLTMDQLAEILHENVRTGRAVEEIAVSRGWVSQEEVALLAAMKDARATSAAVREPEARPEPAPAETPPPTPSPSPSPSPTSYIEPLILDPEPRDDADPGIAAQEPVVGNEPRPPRLAVAPEPPEAEPAPEAAAISVVEPEEPMTAPAPAASAPPEPMTEPAETLSPAPVDTIAVVVVHLENGSRIWASWFSTAAEAQARAQEYADALIASEAGSWPSIGGWAVRPDTVVAVEVTTQLRGA